MGSLKGMIFVGPWGGPGGDNWIFKANNGITQILIRENVNIQSISFKDAIGNISGTFGGRDDNVTYDPEKKIELHWPSEYLKSICGTYGNYWGVSVMKSLSFITNLTTYGPFGTTSDDDKPFSIPIADSVVVGFFGRAGYYLDALGILVQPVDSHETVSFGPWGGPGGDEFSFKVGSWIKEIIVHDGLCINSIAFKDAEGHYYGKFGGLDPNDIGVERIVVIDEQLEHLACISGTYGTYKGLEVITSLSFTTNLTSHGPFGSPSGTSFSIPIQASLVIGFHGRSGYYLDTIGIFVKSNATN